MTEQEKTRMRDYQAYCNQCIQSGKTPESYNWWLFLGATDAELRPYMLRNKDKHRLHRERHADEVLVQPERKIWDHTTQSYITFPPQYGTLNPEYIQRCKELRAFQKKQKENDPQWMMHDRLTKAYEAYDAIVIEDLTKGEKGLSIEELATTPHKDLIQRVMGIYPEKEETNVVTRVLGFFKTVKKRYKDKKDIKDYHKKAELK
jgi:hypothetical protein